MHVDHALPPGIAEPFLEGLQGVLSGHGDAGTGGSGEDGNGRLPAPAR